MTTQEPPVSHTDLYHKLGKLEGLMETMMASVSAFQSAIKDVHSRIDSIEQRQRSLEKQQSTNRGSMSALASIAKDFAVPLMAIATTWLVATTRQQPQSREAVRTFSTPPQPEHSPSNGNSRPQTSHGTILHSQP